MKHNRAFTLVEILVVIAIIMILASMATIAVGYFSRKSAQAKAEAIIHRVEMGLESYRTEFGDFPESVADFSSRVLYSALAEELVLRCPSTDEVRRRVGPFVSFKVDELTTTREIKGPYDYVLRYNKPGRPWNNRPYDLWRQDSDKDNSEHVDIWFAPPTEKSREAIEAEWGRTGPPTNWRR